jgi:hypothetical protein
MRSSSRRHVLWVVLGIFAAGLGGLAWLNSELTRTRTSTFLAADAWPVECPDGTRRLVQPWGFSGYSVGCYRTLNEHGAGEDKHGPFLGFEHARLSMSGQFTNGEAAGTWTYHDKAGRVIKTVSYTESP